MVLSPLGEPDICFSIPAELLRSVANPKCKFQPDKRVGPTQMCVGPTHIKALWQYLTDSK